MTINIMQNQGKTSLQRAHVIVLGNEKGGSGKSTVAMHVAVGLLRLGYRVGTIDLDSHQATFTAYMRNRWAYAAAGGEDIPAPDHIHLDRPDSGDLNVRRDSERQRVEDAVAELSSNHDYIVIDTPGSDRFMSIIGHSLADTLITPMNDSFVDLDLLARIDSDGNFIKPSIYTDMVSDLRRQRGKKDGKDIRWFVLRNRLGHIGARNQKRMAGMLEALAPELGFTVAPGFGERVIFRELFLKGLTLLDLRGGGRSLSSLSNLTARQEVRHLIRTILPERSVSTLSLLQTA